MEQRLGRTAMPDGREVAYAVCGSGPALVCPPGWTSHLELGWAIPQERRFYEALAQGRTLIRYDRPGCGLSSREPGDQSPLADQQALAAVLDAVGVERCALIGSSMGAQVAAVWAAEHPSTVSHLVLYGGWVRGADVASRPVQEHVIGLVSSSWGLGSDVLADILMADEGPGVRAAFVQYQRESASPDVAAAVLAEAYAIDIGPYLGAIRCPTLVIHRAGDRAAPLEQGHLLAESIPEAQFTLLQGRTHVGFLGDAHALVAATRRFLGLPAVRARLGPSLTARQRQVAELVAGGLTNREIAERLGIDERSAEGHLERIRNRLGFRSRAQVAAWWAASST